MQILKALAQYFTRTPSPENDVQSSEQSTQSPEQIRDLIKTKLRSRSIQTETNDSLIIGYNTAMCWYTGPIHRTGKRPSVRYEINKKTGNVTVTRFRQASHNLPCSDEALFIKPYEPSKRRVYTPREFSEYLQTKSQRLGKSLPILMKETVAGKIIEKRRENRLLEQEINT